MTIWRITAKGAMAHRRRYSLTALAVLLGVPTMKATPSSTASAVSE